MKTLISMIILLTMVTACSVSPQQQMPEAPSWQTFQTGEASWYSVKTNRGTHTASGQKLIDSSHTAAHKTLPFGTKVMIKNLRNGKSEIVVINNRGPFIKGRVIDVTAGVADKLGFKSRGVAPVELKILK
jgi:rare lipoprotein A